MKYASAWDYLQSQKTNRPLTLKEISLSTDKSEFSTLRELNGLLLRGEVHIITVRFNKKSVPFYTVRDDVVVDGVHAGRPRPGNWGL